MAVYLDDLFRMGEGHDWAILGAGVRDGDRRMQEVLAQQDNLFSVIEVAPNHSVPRVVGAMTGFVPVAAGNEALIAAMSDPAIRIVSMTVTEGGYFIDPDTGRFDPAHPAIAADAAKPERPDTAFGAIVAALRTRRMAGNSPFTVMSCDNVPHNGQVTRDAVVGLCHLFDAELAEWIAANVAFPSSMVDRITPATGARERALAASLGLNDLAPVTCEPFRQWVMEDRFPTGRPALEKVGVTFTDRVDLFETMKIRILNGGHAILAYPSGLAGVEYVHEAMADPILRRFLDTVLTDEVLPFVPPVPDTDLGDYKRLILDRFANPEVADTIRRLCLDGSNRQPKFIVPSLRDNLAAGRDANGLILLSALWCRYCQGETDDGTAIAPNDPAWEALQRRAQQAAREPEVWLQMRDVYGELADHPGLHDRFAYWLGVVSRNGARAALESYLQRV